MASKPIGKRLKAANPAKTRTPQNKKGDSSSGLSNGDTNRLDSAEDNEQDYHNQLDQAVKVIGEANSTIKRKEDRMKALETENIEIREKLRVAKLETRQLRSDLEAVTQEKQEKGLKEVEKRKSQEKELKTLQQELDSKESMMADREIELRRRELELDQRVVKIRRQQAEVEKQLLDVLDKENSFDGRVHRQMKKDEELKRRDRALTVRESVIADKEDVLTKKLEELKIREAETVKVRNRFEKEQNALAEMRRRNDEVALKLAEKKDELNEKEKEVGMTLIALRRDEADLIRKEEKIEEQEELLIEKQTAIVQQERVLTHKGREVGDFDKEKKQFAVEKQRWAAEATKIRNEVDTERKNLRERELQLKTKERELQIKEKEWESVKSALNKHLQEQEKLERSIKAIEVEQHRIGASQSVREQEHDKQKEQRDQLLASLTAKEQDILLRINDLQRKEQDIKSREMKLDKEEEVLTQREAEHHNHRDDNRPKDGDQEMSLILEDISESRPSYRDSSKPYAHTPLEDGSTPESGFSDSHAGEYRILQRGILSANHRNQAFTVKTINARTVGDMKMNLLEKEGIPIAWQQFYYNSKLLPDTAVLPAPENLPSGVLDLRLAVPKGTLPLTIRMNSAISRRIEFDEKETIGAAKTRIYKSEGIPPHQQNLFYGETELQDKFRLTDYHIQAGSELFLRLHYDILVVLSQDRLLYFTVEDLDTVGSLKALIYEETRIHVDHQVLAYGATTLADQRPLAHYRVTEGSRIFLSFVISVVVETPTRQTFTIALHPEDSGHQVKRLVLKLSGMHPPLQNLVQNGQLLDDETPIVDQLQHGGTVQVLYGNILVLDESGKILIYDVKPWHSVAKVKEMIARETRVQTRHQHLMHGEVELKTVNRAVKHFGVKRADVLVVKMDPKSA